MSANPNDRRKQQEAQAEKMKKIHDAYANGRVKFGQHGSVSVYPDPKLLPKGCPDVHCTINKYKQIHLTENYRDYRTNPMSSQNHRIISTNSRPIFQEYSNSYKNSSNPYNVKVKAFPDDYMHYEAAYDKLLKEKVISEKGNIFRPGK